MKLTRRNRSCCWSCSGRCYKHENYSQFLYRHTQYCHYYC